MELDIYVATWFKTCSKFRHGASDTFGNASNTPMIFRQHRDDAVGLTELLRAKDDCLIPVQTHTGKGSALISELRDLWQTRLL
jgi:hypothetical protein